jgi:hypothetical protein
LRRWRPPAEKSKDLKKKKKKVSGIFQTPTVGSPWKMPFFLGHDDFCERNTQPTFKFNMKKGVFFVYRMVPRMPSLLA